MKDKINISQNCYITSEEDLSDSIDETDDTSVTTSLPDSVENNKNIVTINGSNDKLNRKRLNYALNLISKTFDDIFSSIEVNKNYEPRDLVEKERTKKRLKDFNCRVSRMLYQAKQDFTTLRNRVNKAKFSNEALSDSSDKLSQLFLSIKNLLVSYLHYIPLSGGDIFPGVLTNILHLVLDVGNLSASMGYSTNDLSENVRKLEHLSSSRTMKQDAVNIQILNQLAKQTLGKPVNRTPQKKPNKSSVEIKPKSNKIFQARTNLARLKRIKSAEDTDSKHLVPEITSFETSDEKIKTVSKEIIKRQDKSSYDLYSIRKRLHNLELLAIAPNPPDNYQVETYKSKDESLVHSDLNYLINRLEIIESDFDLIATKYNL